MWFPHELAIINAWARLDPRETFSPTLITWPIINSIRIVKSAPNDEIPRGGPNCGKSGLIKSVSSRSSWEWHHWGARKTTRFMPTFKVAHWQNSALGTPLRTLFLHNLVPWYHKSFDAWEIRDDCLIPPRVTTTEYYSIGTSPINLIILQSAWRKEHSWRRAISVYWRWRNRSNRCKGLKKSGANIVQNKAYITTIFWQASGMNCCYNNGGKRGASFARIRDIASHFLVLID